MRVVLLYNPISGRGEAARRSLALAAELSDRLGRDDVIERVSTRAPRDDESGRWLDDEILGARALVVCGGDGAVRLAARSAARTGVPIVQFPSGTENLFAREFAMRADAAALAARLRDGIVEHVDLGSVDDEPMVLMASVGFDASVVHDLAAHRTGGISHLSYARPIVRQAIDWRADPIDVEVDGERVATGFHGVVVVANCRQYGARLDPAPHASMRDGRLDVVGLPARGLPTLVSAALHARFRRLDGVRGVLRASGTTVTLRGLPPLRVQLDGDPLPLRDVDSVRIEVRPRALPVLVLPT